MSNSDEQTEKEHICELLRALEQELAKKIGTLPSDMGVRVAVQAVAALFALLCGAPHRDYPPDQLAAYIRTFPWEYPAFNALAEIHRRIDSNPVLIALLSQHKGSA